MTNIFHTDLQDRWTNFSLCEQMANVGAEVGRTINWRKKGNPHYAQKAINRALELLVLTLEANHRPACLREVARVKEAVLDYFYGENEFRSSDILWKKYFDHFNYAARKER